MLALVMALLMEARLKELLPGLTYLHSFINFTTIYDVFYVL